LLSSYYYQQLPDATAQPHEHFYWQKAFVCRVLCIYLL
jgi:hypothetical protein